MGIFFEVNAKFGGWLSGEEWFNIDSCIDNKFC